MLNKNQAVSESHNWPIRRLWGVRKTSNCQRLAYRVNGHTVFLLFGAFGANGVSFSAQRITNSPLLWTSTPTAYRNSYSPGYYFLRGNRGPAS